MYLVTLSKHGCTVDLYINCRSKGEAVAIACREYEGFEVESCVYE